MTLHCLCNGLSLLALSQTWIKAKTDLRTIKMEYCSQILFKAFTMWKNKADWTFFMLDKRYISPITLV